MRAPIAPHNLALLVFIRQHQPVGTYDAFSLFEGAGESASVFSRRLAYLKLEGWLTNEGSTYRGVWRITQKATEVIDHDGTAPSPCRPQPVPRPAVAKVQPLEVVQPRRVDVMNGPVYHPKPSTCHREGCFDFAACPSINLGRPVPFKSAETAPGGNIQPGRSQP